MSAFDDLIPTGAAALEEPPAAGAFADLVPRKVARPGPAFADLVPTPEVPEPAGWWTGFGTELRERAQEVPKKVAGMVPSSMRLLESLGQTAARAPMMMQAVPPETMRAAEALGQVAPEALPAHQAAAYMEQKMDQWMPPAPDPGFSHKFMGGVGSMAAIAGPGMALKAAGATRGAALAATGALGFTAEFDDAFARSRARGDAADLALAKSLGYASVATMIENWAGAGRVVRRYFPNAQEAARQLTARGVSKEVVKSLVAGGAEEGSQRLTQDWIVEGKTDGRGALEEAAIGSLVEAVVSLPSAGRTAPAEAKPTEAISEFGGVKEEAAPVEAAAPPAAPTPAPAAPALEPVQTPGREETGEQTQEAAAVPQVPEQILAKTVRELSEQRAAIPASLVQQLNTVRETPWALPPGYAIEGAQYVYTAPPVKLTPEQEMAEETRQNMAAFRQQVAEAQAAPAQNEPAAMEDVTDPGPDGLTWDEDGNPDWSGVAPEDVAQIETWLSEPVEANEETQLSRAEEALLIQQAMGGMPDILDWIEGHVAGGVRLPEGSDFSDYLGRARGRARAMLSQSRGEAWDEVIREMHGQGMWPGIETADDLAEAMIGAGAGRIETREATAQGRKQQQARTKQTRGARKGRKKQGLVSGTRAEAWADGVIEGAGTTFNMGPARLAAAGVVKAAAILERLAVRSFETFKAEWLKMYPGVKADVERLYQGATDLLNRKVPAYLDDGQINPDRTLASEPKPLRSPTEADLKESESAMFAFIRDQYKQAKQAYEQLNESKGGKIIGTDIARDLCPEFSGSRWGAFLYFRSTVNWAAEFSQRMIKEAVSQDGRGKILLISGGGMGAGKSTAVKELEKTANVVWDNTMRNEATANEVIDLALRNGWRVRVAYVYRPVPLAMASIPSRSNKLGRYNNLAELPREHRKAQAVFGKLVEKWQTHTPTTELPGRIEFAPFSNDQNGVPAHRVSVRDVLDPNGKANHNEREQQSELEEAKRIYEQARDSGTYPPELLERIWPTGDNIQLRGVGGFPGPGNGQGRPALREDLGAVEAGGGAAGTEQAGRGLSETQADFQGWEQDRNAAVRNVAVDGSNPASPTTQAQTRPIPQASPSENPELSVAQRNEIIRQLSQSAEALEREADIIENREIPQTGEPSGPMAKLAHVMNRRHETLRLIEALAQPDYAEAINKIVEAHEWNVARLPKPTWRMIKPGQPHGQMGWDSDVTARRAEEGRGDAIQLFYGLMQQVKQDRVEALFQKALDATNPATKPWVREGVTGAIVWLPQGAAHATLLLARAAYRGGKSLAEAIRAGVDYVRGLNLPGFNAAELEQWLVNNLGLRETGRKIYQSANSEELKTRVREYLYQARSNATEDELAAGIVQDFGADAAEKMLRNRPAELPGAVWSRLLGQVTRALAAQEREARQTGDAARAEQLAERQAALWDAVLPQITDVAQSLQAMRGLVEMSPDAIVARGRRTVNEAHRQRMDQRRGELNQVRHAVDEGRKAGIEDVRQDPESNDAARAAVDEAIGASESVRKGIVMELAEPWASSSAVLNHAREQVRSKANELLNTRPRPAGLTPREQLRQILDDLAARAASIFAAHIQGAEPELTIVQKYQQRLGLTEDRAQALARAMSKEWDRQLTAAQARLPKRIAAARAKRMLGEAATDSQVDAEIHRQLRELNLRLGDVLEQEAAARAGTGQHLAERVVQASGLSGPAAEKLRATLQRRWDALVAAAQRRALAEIQRRSGVRVAGKVKDVFERVLELDRLGALNAAEFFDVVKQRLGLKELTGAQARELRRLARAMLDAPEGWQKQRAAQAVLRYNEELKGELSWWDAAMAVWYANIFSGPPTHAANLVGNGLKLAESVLQEVAHRPVAAAQILNAAGRGLHKGAVEAGVIVKTGQVEGTRLLKMEPAMPLERLRLPGISDYLLTPWRLVGRALAAVDMLFFKTNEEIRWTLAARKVAKDEGHRGDLLRKRVQELLHHTETDWKAAKAQAAAEGLTGRDFWRRVREIIEQHREASMPGSLALAREYALKQTYNAEPYGVVGRIAEVLNTINQKLVVTRFAMPVVRIVANIINESLNYFPPVGLARVALAHYRNTLDGRPIFTPDDKWNLAAQAATGTVLWGALWLALGAGLDDDDPPLLVTGQGPRTKAQRDQLKATGWRPNTVKLGDRYFSYQESQLAIPLAILGNYFDAMRYKNLDREDALNRSAYALQTFSDTLLDRRLLSGISDLLEVFRAEGVKQPGTELARFLSRTGSGFVAPNALKWVDQVFDPTVYEPDDVQGALLANVPVARRQGRPAINALGDPITRGPVERFTVPAQPDVLVQTLAGKQAWVPMPNAAEQIVGDRRKGPDYYRPMTSAEYYDWIATSGRRIREELTLNLDRIVLGTDEEAQALVRRISSKIRAEEKKRFW